VTAPTAERVRAVVRAALVQHAADLGIDPATVRYPRPGAVTALTGDARCALSVDVGVYGKTR
jgi:hypothetical protein